MQKANNVFSQCRELRKQQKALRENWGSDTEGSNPCRYSPIIIDAVWPWAWWSLILVAWSSILGNLEKLIVGCSMLSSLRKSYWYSSWNLLLLISSWWYWTWRKSWSLFKFTAGELFDPFGSRLSIFDVTYKMRFFEIFTFPSYIK